MSTDETLFGTSSELLKKTLFENKASVTNVITTGPQRNSSYNVGRRIDAAIEHAVNIGAHNAAVLRAK